MTQLIVLVLVVEGVVCMRIRNRGVAGMAALMLLVSVLLSGCELREGAKSEYGSEYGLNSTEKLTDLSRELPGQSVRKF